MIGLATVGAIVGVLLVGLVVLVRKPADTRSVLRWSALAITVLVAAAMRPKIASNSGLKRPGRHAPGTPRDGSSGWAGQRLQRHTSGRHASFS
ncbi:hypothetical protein [Micromonospora ureilytica]|uniref:hypothetical protein n=1 Tax=Micromonospora ureilytica TaxID=709868 RepID=UPI0040391C8F